jgi:hypothetical protein
VDNHEFVCETIANGFEDELEKVGVSAPPGLRNLLRKGLKKLPIAALLGGSVGGAGYLGYQAGESEGEAKIPAAFNIGAQIGAEAQAQHDMAIIQQLQQQLAGQLPG